MQESKAVIMAALLIKPHILRQVNKGRVLINRVRVMCGGTVAYHGRRKQGVSIVQSDTKEMSVFTRQRRTLGAQLAGTIEPREDQDVDTEKIPST